MESSKQHRQDFGFTLILTFFGIWLFWWFWLNTVGRLPSGLRWPSIAAFDGLAILSVILAWRRWKPSPPKCPQFNLWYIPTAISLCSAIFYCCLLIPMDWDGLTYHLPPVIEAYQKGQWGNIDNPFFAVQAYFKLVESLYLLFVLHFGPHGYLLLGLLPLVIGAWAVSRLCRHFSLPGYWAIALWCTYPIVVKQAHSLYIDGFVAIFGICTALAIYMRRLDFFSISLALFIGSKPSAFVPGGILLVSWTVRKFKDEGLSFRSLPWVPGLLSILACLGTFIPNYIRYSNPIYPFQITLFGKVVFPGFSNAGAPGDFPSYPLRLSETTYLQRIQFSYLKSPPIPYWDMIQGAMGFPLFILGMIGLTLVIVRALRLRRTSPSFPGAEFAVGIPVSKAIWMPRYHQWLGGGLALWSCEAIAAFPRLLRGAVWCVLLLQSLWLWTDRVWVMGKKPEWEQAIHTRNWVALGQLIASRWGELKTYGEPQEAKEPWDMFRIEARKKNGPFYVCDDGPQMIAALYGQDFKNQVIWVSKDNNSGTCDQGVWRPKQPSAPSASNPNG